jgi:large subunit ribosomal protein L15
VVNVGRLQVAFDAGKLDPSRPITGATLVDAGVINQLRDGVRLLGKGDLSAKVSIEVEWASAAAMAAVEKAGGEVSVLRKPKTDSSAKKGRQSKKAKSSEAKDQAEEVAASDAVQNNDGASDSDSNPE